MIMDRLYGGVCYAGIDTDPELKYPKGAGRVAFSNQQSYIAAISARFVQLQHGEIDKRVSEGPLFLRLIQHYTNTQKCCTEHIKGSYLLSCTFLKGQFVIYCNGFIDEGKTIWGILTGSYEDR
jgi:hypothetical protein